MPGCDLLERHGKPLKGVRSYDKDNALSTYPEFLSKEIFVEIHKSLFPLHSGNIYTLPSTNMLGAHLRKYRLEICPVD